MRERERELRDEARRVAYEDEGERGREGERLCMDVWMYGCSIRRMGIWRRERERER